MELETPHLKVYCRELGQYGNKMQLRMFLFQRSLTGSALKWYAHRWRELAAQVKPLLDEREMISTFLEAQQEPYYEKWIAATGSTFAEWRDGREWF